MNAVSFRKMAHGDVAELRELARDYFSDTRLQLAAWKALLESGNFNQMRANLHCCKGGAPIFGLERMIALITSLERDSALEDDEFDFAKFENELSAAENAVMALTD